jgi:nitrate/TMAO reductase-like tetraheme cytochrome c subunit
MVEEQKVIQQAAPPRFRGRLIKVLTLTLFFIILLFTVGFLSLETTSSSQFCASCHEMKPEYYTWKASSHSEVGCVNCHTGSTKEEYAKAKANGLVQVFKKATQTYTAPIRMPNQIKDESCEKCHNIFTREVTPTGDLIIPHDKHKEKGIECTQCHQGIAHGKIADRKMTYQTDYAKWDDILGRAVMTEPKYIKPDMATCMECHTVRKAPLECTACHTTGMIPENHKRKEFKTQLHGSQARKDLDSCNKCHEYMSKEEIEELEPVSIINKFLKKGKIEDKTHQEYDYAKQNTFCRDCHSIRPPGHTKYFMKEHGTQASQNREKCLACHEYQKKTNTGVSTVACSSCHPSIHNNNNQWKERHPVPIKEKQEVTNYCYTCHNEPKCSACHVKEWP